MKKYINKHTLAVLGAMAFLSSCDPEIDAPKADKGEADFSNYIAVGNSLTAGYADNGLYRTGQINSFPNILAGQFKMAGGGEFNQPLFTEAQKNGSGYMKLNGFTATGNPIIGAVTTELAVRGGTAAKPLYTEYLEPINNLGIPGIAVRDIKIAGYGSALGNPYFERITPDASQGQTYLARVDATDHTFFTNWLGNNDVLGYATSGGMSGAITDETLFRTNYGELMTSLTKNNAKGVVATIPDVTLVPFFTTVGPTFKATLTAAKVPGFVALTGAGNSRIQVPTTAIKDATNGTVLFTLTSSAYLSLLGKPTGKYWRDLAISKGAPVAFLLATYSLDTTQVFGVSAGNPLPSSFLLDNTELANIKAGTDIFNGIIREAATNHKLGLFDVNTFFQAIQPVGGKPALVINTVNYTPAYIQGNIFSLDGVHLTQRGYAIVANEFIKVINTKYNAKLPQVDVNNYQTVLFP